MLACYLIRKKKYSRDSVRGALAQRIFNLPIALSFLAAWHFDM